jgi:amidohydrolase
MEINMLVKADGIKDKLIEWRRTIHRHPEVGFKVFHTAEFVEKSLMKMNVEVQSGVGKTGVVAKLGDGDGPVIAIRADMDALPIQEANDVEYASQIPGNMHACGHDAHTAMLLGVGALLSREKLPGQVRLIFQPSEENFDEEGVSGAPRMIEDGAMDDVDIVIALHVDGILETGKIAIESGPIGAAVDTFHAYIVGQGGHGAYPHQSVDPIWLASYILSALYAIPSRRVTPLQPCVVSVGVIQGGSAENVIPDEVYLEGTLRSYADDVRESLIHEVEAALKIAQNYGGDYRLHVDRGYPVLENDETVVGWLRNVGAGILGSEQVGGIQKSMGAEDFAYMTRSAKGAMFKLGVKVPGGESKYLHTSTFDIDENALPFGTAILCETALRYLHGDLV